MSFLSGALMFNRCNKAGAAEIFTNVLRQNPNNYQALMWRAKSYFILGQATNGLEDYQKAAQVSNGFQKELAMAELEYHCGVTWERAVEIFRNLTIRFPRNWQCFKRLGDFFSMKDYNETAADNYQKSVAIVRQGGDLSDPELCWLFHDLAHIYLKKGDFQSAKSYYENAIELCLTHTASHIGLCQANTALGNTDLARQNFQTAKEMNPVLVTEKCGMNTYEDLQRQMMQATSEPQASANAGGTLSGGGGGRRGGNEGDDGGSRGGGKGGNGGGGGGGNDDDVVNALWKTIKKEAPKLGRHRGRTYAQSKCGRYWYSKDTARHGGAAFKRYRDTRSSLEFLDSLDSKLDPMSAKHESREGTTIKKSEMTGI